MSPSLAPRAVKRPAAELVEAIAAARAVCADRFLGQARVGVPRARGSASQAIRQQRVRDLILVTASNSRQHFNAVDWIESSRRPFPQSPTTKKTAPSVSQVSPPHWSGLPSFEQQPPPSQRSQQLGDEAPLVLSRPNEHTDFPHSLPPADQFSTTRPKRIMITTRDVDPCESKMLHAKIQVHVQQTCIDASDFDCRQVDEESRKELVRRGAVGRRCAVVALPADVLAAIAEIAELKW